MKNLLFIAFLIFPSLLLANTDGRLAWRQLYFCDAGGVCVEMKTSLDGSKLQSVVISDKQGRFDITSQISRFEGYPDLSGTELSAIIHMNGCRENELSVPVVVFDRNDNTSRKLLKLRILAGKVIRQRIESENLREK